MPDQRVIGSLPTILDRLKATYPNARYELDWENPLQLLVATILAAQCTDERVNQVTPAVFKKFPDAKAYANANLPDLEESLKLISFYRQKAKSIQNACKEIVERYNGEVPPSMEEMVTLPGVGHEILKSAREPGSHHILRRQQRQDREKNNAAPGKDPKCRQQGSAHR